MNKVFNYLDTLGIKYDIVYHKAAFTTIDADKYIEGKEGVRSKTLFMSGRKNRKFYLIIMDENKRVDIKSLNELLNEKLSFASSEYLKQKLGLSPGVVSLFGLLNNIEHDVNVVVDKELLNESIMTFHPNDNTATIFISMSDMFKILDDLKYEYKITNL